MRILIYTMYFSPEPVGIAPMATDLARYLGERGWDVAVVAGMPKLPAWEPYDAYRGSWFRREGNVLRTWVYIPPKPGTGQMPAWQRILHDSSVALSGFAGALTLGRADLILSITPPLQLAVAAIALKKIWRCPLVNWIQDVVPDTALNVGMMQEGFAIRLARRLESFVYNRADSLAVISEGMRANLLRKGVPAAKIAIATNWADPAPFNAPCQRAAARAELGVGPGDFVLMYGGSFAAKQVLENVVRAMKLLEGDGSIHAFLVGDGIRKEAIQREIERLGVPRMKFLPLLGPAEYARMLSGADLLIVNQSRDLIDALTPSKLLTYLLAEKPVIAAVNAESDAAGIVRESGCGLAIEPENPGRFAMAVRDLKSRPADLARMAAAGSRYVRLNYAKDVVLLRFEEFLKSQYHS